MVCYRPTGAMLRHYVALRGAVEVKGASDGRTEDKRRPADRCATQFDWKAEDSINAVRRGARRGRRAWHTAADSFMPLGRPQ